MLGLEFSPCLETLSIPPRVDKQSLQACCALGPVLVVDGKYYSKPSTEELEKIVAACD